MCAFLSNANVLQWYVFPLSLFRTVSFFVISSFFRSTQLCVSLYVCLSFLSLSFSFSLSLSIYSLFVFFSLFLSVGYKSMHGQYIDENLCMIIAIICLNNDLYVISINMYNLYILLLSIILSLPPSLSLSHTHILAFSHIIIDCLAWHFFVLSFWFLFNSNKINYFVCKIVYRYCKQNNLSCLKAYEYVTLCTDVLQVTYWYRIHIWLN